MSKPEPNTEEQSLRKLVLRAINFNTDATSIAHDIENIIADHQALIETEKREAYRQGGIDELKTIEPMTHEGRGTIAWEMDAVATHIEARLKALDTKANEEGKK